MKKIYDVPDLIKSLAVLAAASLIGLLFDHLGFSEANIITVYILGVLVISVITKNRAYSLSSSIVSVLVFNFLFTDPRYTLNAYGSGYPVTFFIMFLSALITSTLAVKLKQHVQEEARIAREREEAAALARSEQLRANLLRAISHDLRTPLTSISGNAGNLLANEGAFDEETKRRLYHDIYDDSLWLINLVENLLSVSRIEDGKINLHLTGELMEDVVSEALQHVNRKGAEHELVVENSEELVLAKMDVKLMVQVLINLVDNAIKYTPPGSVIKISTRREKDWIVTQVADNGPGISDELKPRVFDMFYSGANQIADSRRSLGLGLSLCKSIITAHGGDISVSDNHPGGTVFTFTLPAEEVTLHE